MKLYEVFIGGEYVDVLWADNPARALITVLRSTTKVYLRWGRQGTKIKVPKGKRVVKPYVDQMSCKLSKVKFLLQLQRKTPGRKHLL